MTRRRHRLLAAAGSVLLAGLGGASAAAADAGRVDFSLRLTGRTPGTPTGMSLHALARGDAKPPALRSLVYHLPAGIRFDTKTLPECTATDAQIQLLGPDACPADSQIAMGTLTAISGFGAPVDPFTGDAHVFNGPEQIIEIVTFPGTSLTAALDRVTISGSTLTAHPPMTPGGPPDGQMAVKSLDYAIAPKVRGGRSLITAPPDCPSGGQWTTTADFGFGDGTSDTETSTTPCEQPASAPSRGTDGGQAAPSGAGSSTPALSLAVRPGRVGVGRRVRLELRVGSTVPRCVAGAAVRLAGHTVPLDARGRGAWVARFRRAGARRVIATSPGCAPALAVVRVGGRRS